MAKNLPAEAEGPGDRGMKPLKPPVVPHEARGRVGQGRKGEAAAAGLLESEGWSIIARNFRAGPGELDIVAFRDETLLFVEVKSWNSYGSMDLERSVDRTKRMRIVETSKIFLAKYRQYSEARLRYDLYFMRGEQLQTRYEDSIRDF